MGAAIDVLVRYGYVVVFGIVLAEQIGLPIPAIPVLLAAGGLGGGRLRPGLVLLSAGVAPPLADMIWYSIGRRAGAPVLRRLSPISPRPPPRLRGPPAIFSPPRAPSPPGPPVLPG